MEVQVRGWLGEGWPYSPYSEVQEQQRQLLRSFQNVLKVLLSPLFFPASEKEECHSSLISTVKPESSL